MSKGADKRSIAPDPPAASAKSAKTDSSRPTTPSSPVQIPRQSNRSSAQQLKQQQQYHRHHHNSQHRQQRSAKNHHHQPDSLSPSVAALLAVTDIPRLRHGSQRQKPKADMRMTVGDIVQRQQVSEKELSWSLTGSPLDLLLSPPEDVAMDDGCSTCDDGQVGSALMSSISVDSVPSLGDSFATEAVSSLDSAKGIARMGRPRRRSSPVRKSLEPVRSPPDAIDDHPLSETADDDEDYFVELPSPTDEDEASVSVFSEPFKPLRAAFKSNLTASLRAIRHAAKSFSTINFPSIPPDDLLSRSILTIDPGVPYTDERMPPVTEEVPSAELRRYLNPTTRASVEAQQADPLVRPKLPTSIQMQTYKIHRSMPSSSTTRSHPSTSLLAPPNAAKGTGDIGPPGMRQREMRENPDFIRIAVMEMAMRKHGKLDDKKPGRAQWALPPRKAAAKPYQIGANGVPARWTSTVYEP
ncbi:hypothetical protein K4F52_000121 [Lecanicillium sp. MT-2017a]|nr:hypothetical protein K4F52_000121 [Lecanicillium sp. MT-2017a]